MLTISSTTLTLESSGRGVIVGRGDKQKSVLDVVERLRGNKKFGQVKQLSLREVDSGGETVQFSVSFIYEGGADVE